MTDHKAIREAQQAYLHMLSNGHTSGYAFAVAFIDLDPAGCIESLLADLDAKTEALNLVADYIRTMKGQGHEYTTAIDAARKGE